MTLSVDMFTDCTSLVGGKGTAYNTSNPRDKTYARPTSTYYWFCGMENLQSITGMSYLNSVSLIKIKS